MTNSSRPPSHLPVPAPFDQRGAGLLLHPTSLPWGHGSGDFGPAAHRFVDFLAAAGQRYWQMLPVCPPGAGNSPYDSPSASAISETLLSLEFLAATGLLSVEELDVPVCMPAQRHATFDWTLELKRRALTLAHQRFAERASQELRHEYERFLGECPQWLDAHATYMALKAANAGRPWVTWDSDLRDRKPAALVRARSVLATAIERHRFAQFVLYRQWEDLHRHCRERNVLLMGDVPIYVAHDSADVWANREVFCLSKDGHREVVAGVPPD
jgi:4-alpha-glucanotransferase